MQAKIVNTGIDTVKVNVKRLNPDDQKPLKTQEVPERLITLFEQWQAHAKERNEPIPTSMTLDHDRLKMFPNGAPAWKYILRNGAIEMKVCPRLNVPMIAKITLLSAYLWQTGSVQDAIDEVHGFLIDVFGELILLQAAQIDLCVDLVGLELPTEWERVFVSHALRKRTFAESYKDQTVYKGRKLETILFSGHGRPVSCKIYDKWAEIEQHTKEKQWFYPLWKNNGWDEQACKKEKASVRRVEYSMEREALHEMDIEDIYDALRNVKRMWAYCTQEWLRMAKPTRDTNRTRWPTHPTWALIQHAFDDYGCKIADALGPLVREKKREVNVDRAVAAIGGYITTFAAWDELELHETDDPETIFKVLYTRVLDRWQKQQIIVQEVVREKKFLYDLKA